LERRAGAAEGDGHLIAGVQLLRVWCEFRKSECVALRTRCDCSLWSVEERGHESIFLLGFSLGSGVVLAVAPKLKVDGLVICQGYSTLREAAVAIGFRRWMTHAMPDVWHNVRRIDEVTAPVLVVHSDGDQLFPVAMARQVHKACGERGELIIASGFTHDGPLYFPTVIYWRPIVEWAVWTSSRVAAEQLPMGD
jgi:uncharacterized protein